MLSNGKKTFLAVSARPLVRVAHKGHIDVFRRNSITCDRNL